jgi:hypothetical protein
LKYQQSPRVALPFVKIFDVVSDAVLYGMWTEKFPCRTKVSWGMFGRISIIETYLQHFQALAVSKNRGKVQLEVSENRTTPKHSF